MRGLKEAPKEKTGVVPDTYRGLPRASGGVERRIPPRVRTKSTASNTASKYFFRSDYIS